MISETLITAAAAPMIKTLVKELFVPSFKDFLTSARITKKGLLDQHEGFFNDYLIRTYDKYSKISVLAIPNSQFQLKDIYVAQTLVKENRFEDNAEPTKIDKLPIGLIKKYQKILITDTAGMGKSTIMKYLFIDLIDNGIKDVGIPIYIELNRLNKDRTILKEIQEELNSLDKEFDHNMLLKFMRRGGFIFLMDGYDEISTANKSEVTKDIQQFITKAGPNNYYILTSRPEDSLASFADFQSFKIGPLSKQLAFTLLTKYDISYQKKVSKALIKELQTGKYDAIDEYLKNPLLVSLLYNAFNYRAEIPLKKHQFYRQVYDALFNAHKLAQGQKPHEKHSGLDIDDFNRVLRYIGYECLIRTGVQFDKDTILSVIQRAKDFCRNLKFGNSDFLQDLMTSVPLFSKDGTEYKWAHKSLMEYFAARFIAEDIKDEQDKILAAIYKSEHIEKYINMLDLYYDLDYESFSKNITYPICKDFVDYCESNSFNSSELHDYLVNERIALLFAHRVVTTQIPYDSDEDYLQRGKIEDEAKQVLESFNSTQQINYNYIGEIAEGVFASSYSKNWPLLKLLFNKQISLFHAYGQRYSDIDFDYNLLNFFENKVATPITIRLGEENIKTYLSINMLLRLWCLSKGYLNYDECKKATKKIYNDYIRIKKKPDFTTGI